MQNLLLTGGTGVLGSRLLLQMLKEYKDTHFYVLVRGREDISASERLIQSLAVYDPQKEFLKEGFKQRVHIVEGSLVHERFSLSDTLYKDLANKIDRVFHLAASTSLMAPYEKIKKTNVDGTQKIIDFCLSEKNKPLSYVSSFSVLGDKIFEAGFRFTEKDFDVGQGFDGSGYQQSKFLAEGLVRGTQADLRWKIFRPGQIYGDSQSGLYPFQLNTAGGFFYDFFSTVIKTQVAPMTDWLFDMSPVDYVAGGILKISKEIDNDRGTYHLNNSNSLSLKEIFKLFVQLGHPLNFVDLKKYIELVRQGLIKANGQVFESLSLKTISKYLKFSPKAAFNMFAHSAVTECNYTEEILKNLGLESPAIDKRLMALYLNKSS